MKAPLCECGCGGRTKRRVIKGYKYSWYRFISGHNTRVYRPSGSNFHEPGWFLARQASLRK